MRYAVEIHIANLELDRDQVKDMFIVVSLYRLENLDILTGKSYDAEIEKEVENSALSVTKLNFYNEGPKAAVVNKANQIVKYIFSNYAHLREGQVFFTITETTQIEQHG